MSNIALALKSEISRLARKELKAESIATKKAAASHRSEIAALKLRLQDVESQLARLVKLANQAGKAAPETSADGEDTTNLRFSAKGLIANRKRLELSAADYGQLVGASGQSIYAWESGDTKPRQRQLPALAALRGLGKKEVLARLEALKNSGS